MSRPTRLPRIALPVLVALATAFGAGGATAQTLNQLAAADKYPLKHDEQRAKKLRLDRLAAYQGETLRPFEKGPQAKAAWAPKAKAALATHTFRLAQTELSGMTDDPSLPDLVREALEAGCDDPLFRYLAERDPARAAKPDPKLLAKFHDTVVTLDASGYGDVCKIYAVYNWLAIGTNLPAADPLRKDVQKLQTRFWDLFERLAGAGTPIADAAVLEMAELWIVPSDTQTRRQRYEEVAGHLEKGKASKSVRLLVEGRFLTQEGWDARGTGAAGMVTAEGWKVYRERIPAAQEKFEAAWEADKTRFQAPTDMVKACRDGGLDRATMETWFARALEANPDNRLACTRKLDYLQPKWHGTQGDYLAFAWMLATAENVGGLLPHSALDVVVTNGPMYGPGYAADPARVGRYYAQPPIWAIFSTACERLLKARPENADLRTVYARGVCLAGKLDVAHAQFEKLGGKYNAMFFPEPGEYERYVAEAKKAAGMKK